MVPSSALANFDLIVVSNDYSTLKMFVTAWRETGSRIDSTASISCAQDIVQSRAVHGIVVDLRVSGALDFIRQLREARIKMRGTPIIVACTGSAQEDQAALAAGANFVAQRPVSTGRIFDLLTLNVEIQAQERRGAIRHRLIAPVTIFCDGVQYRALTSDLSQGGMSIRSARRSGSEAPLDFFFEVSSTAVAGHGRIMWTSENGYAGIRFESVRCSNAVPFPEWLDRQGVLLSC